LIQAAVKRVLLPPVVFAIIFVYCENGVLFGGARHFQNDISHAIRRNCPVIVAADFSLALSAKLPA
jgi:hypothetical protein